MGAPEFVQQKRLLDAVKKVVEQRVAQTVKKEKVPPFTADLEKTEQCRVREL
jgi:hypothetical protein